jgi:hypothetical protein
MVTRITPIEVASALNRKLREGALTQEAGDRLWRLFRIHRRDQYRVIAPDEPAYVLAEGLLFVHRLRAYDAVQLATALRVAKLLADAVKDYRFCTADQRQATAAAQEGLDVEFVA